MLLRKERENLFILHGGVLAAILLTGLQFAGLSNALKIDDGFALLGAWLVILLRFIYLSRFSDISLNFSRVALWFAWDLSLVVLPFLLFDDYVETYYSTMGMSIAPEDIAFTVRIGAAVLLIHFLISIGWKNERFKEDEFFLTYSDSAFYLWMSVGFFVIVACLMLAWRLGTGQFGFEGTRLPFKLSGIINFFAYYFSAFYIFFITDNFVKRGKPLIVPLLMVSFVGGLQMIVSLSKSSLIVNLIMMFVYLIMGRWIRWRFMASIIVLLLIGFVAGGYVSSYRDSKINDIQTLQISKLESGYKASSYVHRIFREGHLFQKFHAYSRVGDLRAALAYVNYSPSDLHTYVLDKTPINVAHSSGCSTLVAFYCFGIPYILIAAALMSAVTVWIDYKLPRLRNAFSALIFRSYIAYFLVINWFYLAFAQVIGAIVMPGESNRLMVNVLIPLFIWVVFYLYIRFFCRRIPINMDVPPGMPRYRRPLP